MKSTVNAEKESLWIPMLQSASKGKGLVEKQLIILGGTPEQQKEFIEQINPPVDPNRSRLQRPHRPRAVPNSNQYARGYTYHDVLDTDQEDVLARLNVYTLSRSASAFGPLLKPLLTPDTIADTLVTILLDWSEPWKWARQLRQWIRVLRQLILSLDEETQIEMEGLMDGWKNRRVGPDARPVPDESAPTVKPPLGSGEWDDGLGLPLSVVCIKTEQIETLERQHQWQEDHFDFLLQWMRTVLLRHGASLCYIASYDAYDVRNLLHSSLSIESLLQKTVVKHNVIDRDKIMVPPNWDSWGKIRILRDAFDVEAVSERWSMEIQAQPDFKLNYTAPEADNSAVRMFEDGLPRRHHPTEDDEDLDVEKTRPAITHTVASHQEFLQAQQARLVHYQLEDEKTAEMDRQAPSDRSGHVRQQVTEQIGTYNINVNGIDVDAEEATRRLREREAERHGRRDGTPTKSVKPAKNELDLETANAFFTNLIIKGKTGRSGVASPRSDRAGT